MYFKNHMIQYIYYSKQIVTRQRTKWQQERFWLKIYESYLILSDETYHVLSCKITQNNGNIP